MSDALTPAQIDRLADAIPNVREHPVFIAGMAKLDAAKAASLAYLRERFDIAAVHPDDGWVNRSQNSVRFAYPAFDRGPAIGELIALGWAEINRGPVIGRFRIVRVVEILGVAHYRFEDHTAAFDIVPGEGLAP